MNGSRINVVNKIIKDNEINIDWFRQQHAEGRVSDSMITALPAMVEQLDDVFPNQWDFQITLDSDGTRIMPFFVIKFDSVIVKNKFDQEVEIRDLYVGIEFYTDSLTIRAIKGTRGELSNSEYESRYLHSHLSSSGLDTPIWFHDFCLGSEGIPQTKAMLRDRWTPQLFKMLLLQIIEFVGWESIDGGPYRNLADIFPKIASSKIILSKEDVYSIYTLIDNYLNVDDFKLSIENGCIALVNDKEFESAISKILPEKYLVRVDNNGNKYIIEGGVIPSFTELLPTKVMWKRVPLKYIKITNRIPVVMDITEYGIHNTVIELIINYIMVKLKTKLILNGE